MADAQSKRVRHDAPAPLVRDALVSQTLLVLARVFCTMRLVDILPMRRVSRSWHATFSPRNEPFWSTWRAGHERARTIGDDFVKSARGNFAMGVRAALAAGVDARFRHYTAFDEAFSRGHMHVLCALMGVWPSADGDGDRMWKRLRSSFGGIPDRLDHFLMLAVCGGHEHLVRPLAMYATAYHVEKMAYMGLYNVLLVILDSIEMEHAINDDDDDDEDEASNDATGTGRENDEDDNGRDDSESDRALAVRAIVRAIAAAILRSPNLCSMYAVSYQEQLTILAVLRRLIAIDARAFGANHSSLFHDAVEHGTEAIVRLLLAVPHVDPTSGNCRALRCAAGRPHAAAVGVLKALLGDERVPPEAIAMHDNEAFHRAVSSGSVQMVEYLLGLPDVDPASRAHDALRIAIVSRANNTDLKHVHKAEALLRDGRVDPTVHAGLLHTECFHSKRLCDVVVADGRVAVRHSGQTDFVPFRVSL